MANTYFFELEEKIVRFEEKLPVRRYTFECTLSSIPVLSSNPGLCLFNPFNFAMFFGT